MSQPFNTVYDVARFLGNEHQLSEWDLGCFIRSMNNIVEPLIKRQWISWTGMAIELKRDEKKSGEYSISIADKKEIVDIRINGTTIQLVPKNRELFA